MNFSDFIADLYEAVFTQLERQWTCTCSTPLVANDTAFVLMSTRERKYLAKLTAKKVHLMSFQDGDKVMTLDWNQKGKYKSKEDLYTFLDCFFVYLEEYDDSLKQRG